MSRAGSIVRVNLTENRIETESTSKYTKDFIGGGAIGAKLMWDNVPPDVKGLDPENMLTFNTGPLTGTLMGTKLEVVTKSPQIQNSPLITAGLGGHFGAELKFAGFDNIAITGKSDKPVYLYIEDGNVELKDAGGLWGNDTQVTQELIRSELRDPDVQIACIGQAGENQVISALILHDIQTAAAQGGVGAVMGSKNLKAIAVRGTNGIEIQAPEEFNKLWDYYYEGLTKGRGRHWTKSANRHQIAEHADAFTEHDLITWGYGVEAGKVCPPVKKEETLLEFDKKYTASNLGCAFCPLQCQKNYSHPEAGNSGVACYTNLLNRWLVRTYDPNLWWKSIVRANAYGLNAVEIASYTGWLMLLYEKGYITAKDTDGIPMEWGSEEACLAVLDKIALQEGFGKYFQNGIFSASRDLGRPEDESDKLDLAIQDRNIMYPIDYNAERGTTIGGVGGGQLVRAANQYFWIEPYCDRYGLYQIVAKDLGISGDEALKLLEEWLSEFAEKHAGRKDAWRAEAVDGKAEVFIANENCTISSDIAGRCDANTARVPHMGFTWDTDDTAKAIEAATGEICSMERLFDTCQRKRILEVAYAILCEYTISEFPIISESTVKALTDKVEDGFFAGHEWDEEGSEQVGEDYCRLRGCDPETGIPTRKELERLGLKYVADKLEEYGLDVGSASDDESISTEDGDGSETQKEERSSLRGKQSEDAVSVKGI
jgi:aldehyde:ferredoxin oxidoreductase